MKITPRNGVPEFELSASPNLHFKSWENSKARFPIGKSFEKKAVETIGTLASCENEMLKVFRRSLLDRDGKERTLEEAIKKIPRFTCSEEFDFQMYFPKAGNRDVVKLWAFYCRSEYISHLQRLSLIYEPTPYICQRVRP